MLLGCLTTTRGHFSGIHFANMKHFMRFVESCEKVGKEIDRLCSIQWPDATDSFLFSEFFFRTAPVS